MEKLLNYHFELRSYLKLNVNLIHSSCIQKQFRILGYMDKNSSQGLAVIHCYCCLWFFHDRPIDGISFPHCNCFCKYTLRSGVGEEWCQFFTDFLVVAFVKELHLNILMLKAQALYIHFL